MNYSIGQRVRWKDDAGLKLSGEGTVTTQPIGSFGSPPPGGLYVQWDDLREPMAVFDDFIEPSESKPKKTRKSRKA